MPARAIDSATIAFGLVSIPIKVYSTSEPSHEIHLHLIHAGCGERVRQEYVCERHGKVVRDDITKGFEIAKGNFVELSKSELAALEAVASDEITIKEFVPAAAIDPIFIDRTYYLGPDKGGARAYGLLREALAHAGLVGVAAYAARGKQYVVVVRPFEDGLAMHQLRYPDEIKPWREVPLGEHPAVAPAELALASKVVAQLEHATFDPNDYEDEVKARVRQLIAHKAKGGEIVAADRAPKPVVTDLMAALKASLEATPPAKPRSVNGAVRTTRARPHAARAPRHHAKRARAHR